MQHINLSLEHWNFFCPITGTKIGGDDEDFTPSPALMGVWVEEIVDEGPVYIADPFKKDWELFLSQQDKDSFITSEILDTFLKSYKAPNWVAFKINAGTAFFNDTAWYIIDMDYDMEKNASDETSEE